MLGGSQALYWILLLIVLLFIGCLMESLASVVMLAPVLAPIGLAMGINERFNSNLMIDKGKYKAVNNSYCGRLSGGEDASIYPAKYDNRQQ